jgi:hypothetical protein
MVDKNTSDIPLGDTAMMTFGPQGISRAGKVWAFLNSAFVLWLLSTFAVAGGAWVFQQWRDSLQKADAAQERFEQLEFEVAGRTSQYLSWFAANNAKRVGKDQFVFADGVTRQKLTRSLRIFGDLPRRNVEGFPYIQEMLPEFKDRSLLSIFAELNVLNTKQKKLHGIKDRFVFPRNDPDLTVYSKLPKEGRREAVYLQAMQFFVDEPDIVPEGTDYAGFKKLFSNVFLVGDIQDYDFPYTDCFDC